MDRDFSKYFESGDTPIILDHGQLNLGNNGEDEMLCCRPVFLFSIAFIVFAPFSCLSPP